MVKTTKEERAIGDITIITCSLLNCQVCEIYLYLEPLRLTCTLLLTPFIMSFTKTIRLNTSQELLHAWTSHNDGSQFYL